MRRSYPPRERRACRGELVQIDGCEHAWFEDRGPTCTLLVYVDLTLQDRLVKELRLRGICDMTAGQRFLPEFRADYNRRFARPPRNAYDTHRPVQEHERLDEIFKVQDDRRVSENLTINYKRTLFVIEDTEQNRRLRRHRVSVHEHADGTITIHHAGRVLGHHAHPKDEARITQGAIVGNKRLADTLEWIAGQQRQRDVERLANPKITLRQKKRIRMATDQTA